jgi:hypothetical protein
MSGPANSTTGWSGARVYTHPITGVAVPSVTTILGVLDKPALPRWAAKETAMYAVENVESWRGLDPVSAVELLKGAPWRMSKGAADAGTDAHAYCEELLTAIMQGRALPEAVVNDSLFAPLHGNALRNVRALIEAIKPIPIAIEVGAWSNAHGYAGTFDNLCIVDGLLTMVDVKSSKAVYPEMALQLSAYRFADSALFADGTELPMPNIARAQIWHVPKEGMWKVVEIRADHEEFKAFLAAKALFEWKANHSANVISKTVRKRKAA